MKPGSIVVVKPFMDKIEKEIIPYVKWLPVQDESTLYMIRSIHTGKCGTPYVKFEEGVMGFSEKNIELALSIAYVKEVVPPLDIEALIEESISQPA